MSRLIDADKIDFNEVFVGTSEFAQDTRNAAQMLINNQPTAFDVDKVVEQIESIKEKEQGACTDEQCRFCEYFNDCWDGDMCDKLALDKAIEIVKEGGVE